MAITETGERLLQVIPSKFNKQDEIIAALFANDNGSGAIEKMFADGQEIINSYAVNNDVYNSEGELLDRFVKFFSYFERNYDETDESLKKRIKAIFVRNHDTTWGTTWNMKHVFEQYFSNAKIYLLENSGDYENTNYSISNDNDINYIKDSTLENNSPDWILSNGAVYSQNDCFEGYVSVLLSDSNCYLRQSVALDSSGYFFLHFFSKGNVAVKVKKENEYLNLWQIGDNLETVKKMERYNSSSEWKPCSIFFKADTAGEVTIEFSGYGDSILNYVDFISLFKKKRFPKFTLICHFTGMSADVKTLHLARGKDDPAENGFDDNGKSVSVGDEDFGKTNKTIVYDKDGKILIDYSNESMFDNAFVTGAKGDTFAQDIYDDILNIVKPNGVRGFVKLVNKYLVN